MHFFAFMEHFRREFSAKHLHITSAAAAVIGRLDEINGNQREMRRKSLVQSWCYVKLAFRIVVLVSWVLLHNFSPYLVFVFCILLLIKFTLTLPVVSTL